MVCSTAQQSATNAVRAKLSPEWIDSHDSGAARPLGRTATNAQQSVGPLLDCSALHCPALAACSVCSVRPAQCMRVGVMLLVAECQLDPCHAAAGCCGCWTAGCPRAARSAAIAQPSPCAAMRRTHGRMQHSSLHSDDRASKRINDDATRRTNQMHDERTPTANSERCGDVRLLRWTALHSTAMRLDSIHSAIGVRGGARCAILATTLHCAAVESECTTAEVAAVRCGGARRRGRRTSFRNGGAALRRSGGTANVAHTDVHGTGVAANYRNHKLLGRPCAHECERTQ